MATPEPLAVGKSFCGVIPETWTKSTPDPRQMSTNRNGPGSPAAATGSPVTSEAFVTEGGSTGIDLPGVCRLSQPGDMAPIAATAGSHQIMPDVANRRLDIRLPLKATLSPPNLMPIA